MSLIESLTARPNPELALFGQFVGDWDMDIEFYNEDGETIYRGLGLWSFGWVLDGHAIQDVFSYPTGSGRGIGTTLRTYSRDRGEWQIVYLGAVSGVTAILHGGREGDNIVLRGTDEDGHNRWTFSDIRADSFSWTGELSPDGATFHVNHRMTGTRRAPSGGGNGAAPEAASFTPQMLGRAENTLRALLTSFLAGTNLTYHTWVLLNATAMGGGKFDRASSRPSRSTPSRSTGAPWTRPWPRSRRRSS